MAHLIPSPDFFRVPLSRFLDTVGDGTGTKNAIGNYSGAEEEFCLLPGPDEVFYITRLIIHISDAGPFNADNYGGLAAPLPNGVSLMIRNGATTKFDFMDGWPVIDNADWSRVTYTAQELNFGSGDDTMTAVLDFKTGEGQLLVIDGSTGDRLAIVLNDNFTGLVENSFLAQGFTKEWYE
jgi:hypothetical protein